MNLDKLDMDSINNYLNEVLGGLKDIPAKPWIKTATLRGAGEGSKVVTIKDTIAGERELSRLIRDNSGIKYSMLFVSTNDPAGNEKPICVVEYSDFASRGKNYSVKDLTGSTYTHRDYGKRPRYVGHVPMTSEMNLGDLMSYIGSKARELGGSNSFSLKGVSKDVARSEKHAQRTASSKGEDNLDVIRKRVGAQHIEKVAGGIKTELDSKLKSLSAEIKKSIDDEIDAMMAGDPGTNLEKTVSTKVYELKQILYRIKDLEDRIASAKMHGVRKGAGWGKDSKTWEYSRLKDKVDQIEKDIAAAKTGGVQAS